MGIDLEDVRRVFLAESLEDLSIVEQALLQLERTPDSPEGVATVFRKFHSLKGAAATVGFDRLAAFAHHIEDLLERLRGGNEAVTESLVTFLLQVVDALRDAIPSIVAGKVEISLACRKLELRLRGGRLEAPAEVESEAVPGADETLAHASDGLSEAVRSLRIDIAKLDQLLTVTGELAIARGRLALLVEEQGGVEIAQAYRAMESLLSNLHRFVTNVRMVPIRPLFQQYARVVRDLALTHQRDIELVVSDQGVEVDTSVVEQIKAPLTHMIRNAVHHGIETPEERRRAGKAPRGRIDLRARHDSGGIVIEVEDDGAGLDAARILGRARGLGIVGEHEHPTMRDVERLIFHQGLSTASEVTSTSGRGVGMDVVLRHLDALGGSVEVRSVAGRGTCFTIRMPLTLAIIDGLLIRCGEGTFGLPMAGVVRCVELEGSDLSLRDGVLSIRGQAVPFIRLRHQLCPGSAPASDASEVVVLVQRGEQQVGLVVDRLLGKAQIVVKPLGRYFQGISFLSGLTILGDGQVSPILNVSGLLQTSQASGSEQTAPENGHEIVSTEPSSGAEEAATPSLSFYLGSEEYTVPMDRVYEIVPFEQVTRLPTTPPFVEGLVSLQGVAVPVIDLAARFGARLHHSEERRSIVVVQTTADGKAVLLGLVVDRLGRAMPVASGRVNLPPSLEALIAVEFISGVVEKDGRFSMCLNVDRLLGSEESRIVADLATAQGAEDQEAVVRRVPRLLVRIAGERCALDLDSLHEILTWIPITRIPGAPSHVLGATNVRGKALPVIDIARRYGLGSTSIGPETCLVLLDVEEEGTQVATALVVDSVEGLFTLNADEIDRTPPFGTRFPPHLVKGMAPSGGVFVPILETDGALASRADVAQATGETPSVAL